MRNQKLISQYTNGEKDNDHETEVNIQNHKESKIDRIFVSQYTNDYIVTYSKKDNSIVGWSIKGQPQPDEFYKLDELKLNKLNEPSYEIKSFSLYKKKLSLCYREEDGSYKQCLIDLKSKQFYELEHSYSIDVHGQYSIGFLHDDDDDDCPKCLFSVGSTPIEFVTLKNGFEGLIVHSVYYGMLSQYVFIDPYHPYRNFGDPGKNNIINGTIDDNNVITKLNRKLSIDDDGNVCIKNGLDESEFQQISNNTTYHKIYNSSTFKEIQSMLNETVEKMEKMEIDRVAPADIEFEDGHIIFKKEDECDSIHFVMNNPIVPNNIVPFVKPYTFSYKLINNKQDLVLINVEQIEIFTRSINGITCQYQWNNDEWKNTYKKFRSKNRRYDKNFINEHYRKLINKILKNEFNDSNSSIPLPKFSSEVHEILNNNPLVENIKNDTEALSKFRKDMLDNKINYQQMKAITTSIVDDKELFSKFGVFKSCGIYFAIILGVAKTVYPFLVVLAFIILGYAQAFLFILRSTNVNDANDPWNLVTRYYFANSNEIINNTTTLVQLPNSNTNLFNWFPTSLFAVYKIITGDSGSLSPWAFQDNPLMTFLLFTFTFFTVIYLLNLFIGLLNIAIGDYNKEEEFLLQKAQIIMEIELFYMFPWWKHDKEWFPEWIYYDMPVTEVRKLINAIDNDKTVFNYYLPVISTDLRNLVALVDEIKEEQKNKFIKQLINELQINQKIQFLQTRIENLQISLQDQQVCAQISQELDALRQLLIYTQNQQTDAQDQQTNVRMRLFFLELNKLDQQMKQIDLLFKQMNSQMNPQMNPQNQQMNPQMNL
ncbi:hypothetical protein RhiirA1_443631 [Rhizophagus irregularis]|uniref:Ion transport domain-containing protein n=1 Tax=Rhizophagus irregularis TaxID=588596 RepID=A0A2N0RI54_9GLOM|nr:hypothetical protein RhiirA1_443631 [Rhizophagus irregularis]